MLIINKDNLGVAAQFHVFWNNLLSKLKQLAYSIIVLAEIKDLANHIILTKRFKMKI